MKFLNPVGGSSWFSVERLWGFLGCFLQLVRGVIYACCEVIGILCLTQAGKAHDYKRLLGMQQANVFLTFKVALLPSVTKKGLFGFFASPLLYWLCSIAKKSRLHLH